MLLSQKTIIARWGITTYELFFVLEFPKRKGEKILNLIIIFSRIYNSSKKETDIPMYI